MDGGNRFSTSNSPRSVHPSTSETAGGGRAQESTQLSGFRRSLGRERDRLDASTNERAMTRTTLDEVCDSQK